MARLIDLIAKINPERSLLFTYAAPPLLLEEVLLRRMQVHGAGEVTVLVDEHAYRDAMLEAGSVRWAGVHYRYYPVRLPGRSAAFHPKLSLFQRGEYLHAIVSSANLTPSSLYGNAAVADALVLGPVHGDAEAFYGILDFLEALLALEGDAVSEDAAERVEHFADEIRARLETVAIGEDAGPQVLHTARHSLLGAVTSTVPASAVREITCVSPFFDREAEGLLRLAEAYPDATLRLLVRPDASLDGALLEPVRKRLRVERFARKPTHLRLHAKTYLFEGGEGTWALTGSANLTAPAWLRGAPGGGNVEMCVLRHHPSPGGFVHLGPDLPGEPVEWSMLRWTVPEVEERQEGPAPLRLADAREQGGRAEVRVIGAIPAGTTLQLTLEAVGGDWTVAVESAVDGAGVLLQSEMPPAARAFEGSIGVLVRALDADTLVQAEGRAWLHRTDWIGKTARERRHHRVLARLEAQGWSEDPTDYDEIVDLFLGLVEDSEAPQSDDDPAPESGAGAHETGGRTGAVAESRPVSREVGELGGVGRARRLTTTRRMANALLRVLLDDEILAEDEFDEEGSESGRAARRRSKRPAQEVERDRRRMAMIDERLVEMVPRFFAREIDEASVELVPHNVEIMLNLLLQRYPAAVAAEGPHNRFLMFHMQRVLAHAFSIEGFARGLPTGWIIRAWGNDTLRESVRHQMGHASVRAAVFLALTLASQAGRTEEERAAANRALRESYAGIAIACGEAHPWLRHDVAPMLDELAERMAARADGLPGPEGVRARLEEIAMLPLPLLAALESGTRLVEAERSGADPGDGPMAGRYRRMKQRRPQAAVFAQLSISGPSAFCTACFTAVPIAVVGNVEQSEEGADCPNCSRILLPFDPGSVLPWKVLAALRGEHGECDERGAA